MQKRRLSSAQPAGAARIRPAFSRASDRDLLRRVTELERNVAELAGLASELVRVVDDPSIEAVLPSARQYFTSHHGEIVQPDRLAAALGTSVGLAVELCDYLAGEGQIAEVL